MIDYLGYILIRVLSFIFCILPVGFGLFIGRRLGSLAFLLSKKRRILAYANLKAAFCKEKGPAEIKSIVKGVYQNLGQVFIEMLLFPIIDKKYINKFVSVYGLERVEEAMAKGNGVIMLTAHFGNWELGGIVGSFLDLPLSVLAREQRHTRLNELLNSYRERAGAKVIKKGPSTRQLVKALRSNGVVGILTDQDAGKFGTFVDFFGRPTSTHSGAFIFAIKTGARVLPAFMIRQNGPYHRLEILEPIDLKKEAEPKKEIISGIQRFSSVLETYIRQFPTQWLWLHKRWKSTPRRSIIILNDGRRGHLNQSIAVVSIIQRFREERGYRPEDTTYKIIDIRYKNRFLRLMLSLCSLFSSSSCQGCMACVRSCLKDESYKAIISSYADIIISCGTALAPVNIFLKRELNAKNIVIMKPSLVSLNRFNLAIIPRHDKPRARKNVLVTVGSPNGTRGEVIQKETKRFLSFLNLKEALRLALILGGNNPVYKMEPEEIRKIILQIKTISERLGMELLVTTSRRTPREIEQLLKDELSTFANCKLLVIANEKNIEGTIPALLGLSNVILVSGDSISMMSEAASSGKFVLVFPLKKKTTERGSVRRWFAKLGNGVAHSLTRYERMVEELSRSGFVKSVEVGSIAEEIENALNSNGAPKRLDDNDKIYSAVGTLL